MPHAPDKTAILDVLARHERAIGDIYLDFGRRFPEQRKFWNDLAADEAKHSTWIQALAQKMGEGKVELKPGSFSLEEARRWLEDLQARRGDLGRGELTLEQALIHAIGLENSILDKRFVHALVGLSGPALDVLGNLEAQTRAHAAKVGALLKQVAPKS